MFSGDIHHFYSDCVFILVAVYISSDKTYSRSGLSEKELSLLKESFAKDPYPSRDTLRNISEIVGQSELRVYRWFNEERRKERDKKIKLSTESK